MECSNCDCVDDVVADLPQAIHIGFPGAEITAFDRVVKKTPDAVAVIGIVFGRIDATLGGDAMGASRAILDTEGLYIVPHLSQAGGGRCTGESGAHDDDIKSAAVGRIDQLHFHPMLIPFLGQRATRNFSIQLLHS